MEIKSNDMEIKSNDIESRNGPHFICVGAQKSGTTWLYECLKHHPEIHLPPIKELHYFDECQMGVSSNVWVRITNKKHWRHQMWRKRVRHFFTHKSPKRWGWGYCYFLKKRNHNWYAKLFRPKSGQIAGDMTPNYSILTKEMAEEIVCLIPDVKIILLLRSPVDRIWSACKMHLIQRGLKNFSEVEASDITAYFSEEENIQRSRYTNILDIWYDVLPKEKIWIGFYDQIVSEPQTLLSTLFHFLGVPNRKIPDHYVNKVVKQGINFPLPKSIEAVMSPYFLNDLTNLQKYLDDQGRNIVMKWCDSINQV